MISILKAIIKKILISNSRKCVRGTVVFLTVSSLFIIGLTLAIVTGLLLLGLNDIYIISGDNITLLIDRILALWPR